MKKAKQKRRREVKLRKKRMNEEIDVLIKREVGNEDGLKNEDGMGCEAG